MGESVSAQGPQVLENETVGSHQRERRLRGVMQAMPIVRDGLRVGLAL